MRRKRDKVFVPDTELLEMSIQKMFNLIILHFKNFYLEQIKRTLPSKNKMFKFKLVESNMSNKYVKKKLALQNMPYLIAFYLHILLIN